MKNKMVIAMLVACSAIVDLNAWGSDDRPLVFDAAGRESGNGFYPSETTYSNPGSIEQRFFFRENSMINNDPEYSCRKSFYCPTES